jgi:hypothetical protein
MKTIGMTCAAVLLLAAFSVAQMEMPKPGPEHKKLDMFAGSWVLDGDTKAGPEGPGGKVTENEKCEWMEGGFYVVCHIDFKSTSMGNGSALSIMGYDTDAKGYTYREFNSWGEFENAKGSLDGDTWTWGGDEKFGKGRFTMKITSPTTYNFTYEMSQDGKTWSTIMDGKATKK